MTQEEIAAFLEISTQQYGKYERAEDRISAARYKALKEFLIANARALKGFSEEEADYAAGPGISRTASPGHDAIQEEWEGLKQKIDVFMRKLREIK